MKRFAIFALVTLLFGAVSVLNAQQSTEEEKSLENTLKDLSRDAAQSYVSPIVSGFGANLNSGWFHRAPRGSMFGIDLEFGVVGMGTFFKDEHKTFGASGFFRFDSTEAFRMTANINDPNYNSLPQAQRDSARRQIINQIRSVNFEVGISGPTIIGSNQDTVKAFFNGKTFTVNVGGQQRTIDVPSSLIALGVTGYLEDAKAIPLVAPQLTIGTFFGSQFTFRYLPDIDVEDFGKVKYFGFGIQHNPGVWFGDILPLDVSASFFTQTLEAGTVFKTKATAFGVNASKRLGWGFLNLTPYAGFMVESSSMTFTYDFIVDAPTGPQTERVEFELTGENKTRITAGVSIKVLIVNINADYNWSKYNSASVGVMFII
ncbi:MAG: hypothetical protein HYY49_08125 [Ignavibacteriales bacterium]|nr:hypothetical protein [Ignavibacteriales bacterium]